MTRTCDDAPASMSNLYPYSLLPVLSVAALLFFTSARRGKRTLGLTMLCLTTAVWSGMLALIWIPAFANIAERFAAIGAFIAASFLHAAYDVMRQRSYVLVWLAYGVASAISFAGAFVPGFLYGPMAMTRGPFFWPAMGLAALAATLPLLQLHRAYRTAAPAERGPLRSLAVAGIFTYAGGMTNAVTLAHGAPVPWGMLLVLASLLVLANVIRAHEPPSERKVLERSLLYSAVAAFLSAGFLLGVLSLMSGTEPFFAQYRAGALLLLFLAALAFEPIRLQIQEAVARPFVRGRAPAHEIARALEHQEEIADQSKRLAEIGTLASAVAHEVRNPIGVLAAHLKLLERRGADAATVAAMREQIERASRFVEDLLSYARPRPLELRMIDAVATAELAVTTARTGLGFDASDVRVEVLRADREVTIEADQGQISSALVIMLDNAFLALSEVSGREKRIAVSVSGDEAFVGVTVEDSGPGVPNELLGRLFSPFVTSRKREGPRPGTGLGLAIARGIVERHRGTIRAGRSEALGGARFDVRLPRIQAVLASSREMQQTR
jgi:signal transduction histidine kinase